MIPWKLGGPTDVENLVLLCTRHHHELHDAGHELQRSEAGWNAVPARAGPHHEPRGRPTSAAVA